MISIFIVDGQGRVLPPPLPTNQTEIPYPKALKHSNKTKFKLNESKNNSLDIFPYH